jgi:shikimate dehydrogenase
MTLHQENSQIDRYAVMGNPIAHSKSPLIHAAFAQQTGQVLQYEAILVGKDELTQAVQTFQLSGGKGLNITIPFKQAACALADQCSERAERAGAVNTLWFDEQGVYGENTDGVGLVSDLVQNQGCQIEGRRVLILGAGGAVRGVLEPLLAEIPAQCVIANRTVSKAESLATLFGTFGKIAASSYEALQGESFDLIINGTSTSLQGKLPALPDSLLGECCYDMMYASSPTLFMQWANKQGSAFVLDGLGMLVEQAAESFYLWRGLKPETAQVIQNVRSLIVNC